MVIIVIDVWDITIPELTGQENRKLYIYLPNSYNENQTNIILYYICLMDKMYF